MAGRLDAAARAESLASMDLAAVALTRYPPGLLAALERIDSSAATVSGGAAVVGSPLWISPPAPAQGPGSLAERIAALAEL
jgi:hypothetical protein